VKTYILASALLVCLVLLATAPADAKLNISTLSAITADLGSVTSGTIDIGSGAFHLDSGGGLSMASGAFTIDPSSGQVSAPHIDVSTIYIPSGSPSYLQLQKFSGGGNRYVCSDNTGDLYVASSC
jgi:hypothetical protein